MQITDETFELQGLLQLLESGTPLPANFPSLIVSKAESILALARELTLPAPEQPAPEQRTPQPGAPAFQAEGHSDLKPAPIRLALNDRIRFTRELFGGDPLLLDETLARVSALTWPKAEDYLLTDLAFDTSRPEIAEFLEILRNLHTRRR